MHTASQKVGWLEGIIEAVHDGILVIDRDGIVQMINEEYTNITGVRKEQIIGQPLIDVRPGAMLPAVLKDGKPRAGVFRKEKSLEYVVDMAPVYEKEEIIGAVSVCKSIPEVYQLTKELQKSKKRVSQLEKTFGRIHQAKYTFSNIIGKNERLKKMISQAKKAASSDLNILLTGESGTGKELFAQAIHNESTRSPFPFVPVNCAAIPDSLLESELFGYEEGSFTNSKRDGKVGLFELANQGTLFLDEIGDMPLDLQAKLLRVLQEGTFRKIGGLEEQKVDVRVIAATNKDLLNMVQKERFREDLYYRINTVHLSIPPLRDRKDDIPDIIAFLLGEQKSNPGVRTDKEAMNTLQQYDWPGNIRELKNAIHYSINMCESNEVKFEHLPETIKKLFSSSNKQIKPIQPLEELIRETEKKAIMNVLEKTGTSVKGKKEAAKLLGISLASLYNKLTKLNIKF
ncbi:sigma 54-interacting transcriptional regulator [Bacillus sp. ISL-47]|uniref:sigma-54 interaction domain-containing protein n=1 Tax=Bacillus sp. ISL-47 TaxID=2819130 RepID=UPI001BE600E6|nr:sigma 54-interacting transcriptional regulator [Bacillus sp. ISL-47]MBT2687205.1 sigma 54-interacting transcriptional regulator [Bacillus sp. ISL-47]MBT2709805.1 sigma 54-interacting transcriptional regulator [Pseudomonas sp. ISL-84]